MLSWMMRPPLLALTFLFCNSGALLSAAVPEEPVRAELFAEEKAVQPGRPFWVGVQLKMSKGWDTYWLNPGDAGVPTQVKWHLPEGFTAGPLLWPYPEKFVTDSLVAFGYTDTVLLMAEITPPAQLKENQKISIQADVNWLACKESCVPGNASLQLALPVTQQLPAVNTEVQLVFDHARQSLPHKEGDLTISTRADQLVLRYKPLSGALGAIKEALFIPEQSEVIDYLAPQNVQAEGGEVTLSVKRAHPDGEIGPVKGILLVSEEGKTFKRAIQVDHPIVTSIPQAAPEGVSSLKMALVFAFLGGMILNVMPCVLPVVALKIFSFVKMAHQRRSTILQHGAIFSLGVVLSFWILSGALLVLRAYGEGIGWGFQLQEPLFVVVLASILFMLGLSLFGVFEFGTSLISLGNKPIAQNTSPLMSSLMSGVLATLVATPCTGPLLGPALGFAMTLPPLQTLTIFTAMGLGMASPYAVFSAFPQLVRFLPKPGNWMIAFKHIMGFLMMATVIWLVWVFGAQTDNMATFVLLAAFLIMAVGCWIFGKWGAFNRPKMTRMVATALAALVIMAGSGSALMIAQQYRASPTSPETTRLVSDETGEWQAYTPEWVAALRSQGIPVFVDFTAKWCLICQANKVILHSSETAKAFREKGVVTMVADWTKKDPVITKQLAQLGRSGVPVYVLFPGNAQEQPYILPQTLTTKVMHTYLDKLKDNVTTVYAH
jgi:thiol:disulfide interchange protein